MQGKEDYTKHHTEVKVEPSANPATDKQNGDGTDKQQTDKKEEQEALRRELDPADCITVYFHVIVSKFFHVNSKKDEVVVKGGEMKGYRAWTDVICKMKFIQDYKNHGLLYEGQTQISKDSLDKCIPYKYMILQANKTDFEYIYYLDMPNGTIVNRCLNIPSKCVQGKEWHQYDDVCMKHNTNFFSNLFGMFSNRYAKIAKEKVFAGEVMLSRIFSILTTSDANSVSSFFSHLHHFYHVYTRPRVMGYNVIEWKALGFGTEQVIHIHNFCLRSLFDKAVDAKMD
ncbi:E3 ubiquitin-protein ligase RNF213-like [Hyperolius riggenbachi]|uniref:E3 ubiquitin-protein ligase RNF213-like n=1 Tax=Hyperolius riggenbachi TaxID=752182 RepID=UPI0035A2858C